jgi:hypothetical protein
MDEGHGVGSRSEGGDLLCRKVIRIALRRSEQAIQNRKRDNSRNNETLFHGDRSRAENGKAGLVRQIAAGEPRTGSDNIMFQIESAVKGNLLDQRP